MYITSLSLQNFRSHVNSTFEFTPNSNLIIGPNGSGKTNILESIYFLSGGKSFRSSTAAQLINWQSNYATVRGQISKDYESVELEVQLVKNIDESSIKRKFYLDKVIKTRPKYLGALKVVSFEPEDLRLVSGSPSRRRDYLDSVFATTEWRYASALSQYNRALKHRNELLDLIRDGRAQKSELFYWDQSLIKNSSLIHTFRANFIKSINSFLKNHPFSEITNLSVNYRPSVINQDKLDINFNSDLRSGYTQAGIHRDDFSFDSAIFSTPDKNLAFWGSRGQQRLAVLALRLGQINYLEETYGEKPILLLDDIFSELDPDHQHLVVDICDKYQSIFTAAESNSAIILPEAKVIDLSLI